MTDETMVGFGRKQAWIAFRHTEPADALRAVGGIDADQTTWRTGVDRCYLTDDYIVATPPLPGAHGDGWTLVVGRYLLLNEAQVDTVALSADLGTEVQYFASYRVAELHRWERAVDGVLVRAFRYVGQLGAVTDWRGHPDDIEREIGLPADLDGDPTVLIGEDDVSRVAARWSVDPTQLDGRPAPGRLQGAHALPGAHAFPGAPA